MQRLAVIDLGTNTFHLLIVEAKSGEPFREIYRTRIFVKLAEEGIQTIGQAAFERGLKTLREFQQIIETQKAEQVRAFGTAALRTAANGPEFIQQVKAITGLDIQLIPGQEEARLIHKGVSQAVPFGQEKNLIMDIGGGSVEFIIADQSRLYWSQSFPIGVAVLFRDWHRSDPINSEDIRRLEAHLDRELPPLMAALALHRTPNLIGASGTFDVLDGFLGKTRRHPLHSQVPVADYLAFSRSLLPTSLSERLQLPHLPSERAEMIIVALILIDFVVRKARTETIIVSDYAMKEGMLQEMFEEKI